MTSAIRALVVVALAGITIACTGGGDGTGSSSGVYSSSSSSSGSSGRSSFDADSGASNSGSSTSSSSSSSSGTTKNTFPCGPSKQCEVGRELCQYIDGSPFACAVITVDNQCNAKSCANAQDAFGYLCERTNFPNATCSYSDAEACQMTLHCD